MTPHDADREPTLVFPLSRHAREQMTRRRIHRGDIDLAVRLGQEIYAAGAVFYVLRKCDIPADLRRSADVRRAEGTTVVFEGDWISTVYRNRDVRHLARKPKRSRRHRNSTEWPVARKIMVRASGEHLDGSPQGVGRSRGESANSGPLPRSWGEA
ncbi:MAG: hypothetical protein RLP09_41820 [Sandaracinaceae bacterium]